MLCTRTSLGALQWISYLQDHSPDLTTKDGRIQIENEYFKGEKTIEGYEVDGFAENHGKKFFYEFNGCL